MSRKRGASGRGSRANRPPDALRRGLPGVGSAARRVGGWTAFSRVTGFLRDALNAALFGAGWVSDAYFMAVRIPNVLRDLFAEGALNSAFVPALSRALQSGRRREAARLFTEVFTLLLLAVGGLCALGVVFAPWVVGVVARGFTDDPAQFALTVDLTRILFPVLLFVSLAALWMGWLNAHGRFGMPAFAPSCMNLTLISAGVLLLLWKPPGAALEAGWIQAWAAATTLGMALQWLVQMPEAGRLGAGPAWAFPPRHPEVARMLSLMGPAAVSLSIVQVNLLVNQMFASFLPQGSVTHLYYGNRLMQLPFGVLGVSLATAVFPLLARQAASGGERAFGATLSRALEASVFVSLPSLIGLLLVAEPVARLAFEYGRFDPDATRAVALAASLYALGLSGYTAVKILVPAFYAKERPLWPFIAALAAMAVNLLLNAAAFAVFEDGNRRFAALALSSSLGAYANFALLAVGLRRVGVGVEWRAVTAEWGRIAAATLGMALPVWVSLRVLAEAPGARVLQVVFPVAVGVACFLFLCRMFGCRSLGWLMALKGSRKGSPRKGSRGSQETSHRKAAAMKVRE